MGLIRSRDRGKCFLNILAATLILATAMCHAQSADTAFVARAAKNAKDFYTKAIGVESHLYNGIQYKEHLAHNNDEGHPYYRSDDWTEGTIFYDGQLYEQVPILFDITSDKLVIEHGYSGAKLQMIDEMVGYFTIFGHTFVRLDSSSSIKPGYYDLLYDGRVKAFAKWEKNKNETIADREIRVAFNESNHYYIYKDNKYHQVKSKSSVLKVLSDRKPELRKFIRKNGISFLNDRADALAQVVKYYDQSGK